MLRINTNLMSLTSQRYLNQGTMSLSKTMERLSSGFRINRAADDAAGLAISEKMTTNIRGNQKALDNLQDGINLIQTTEGSLSTIESQIQRMRELIIQAANDTHTASDREKIQEEVNQLIADIDRTSNVTEYNTRKVLLNDSTEKVNPPTLTQTGAVTVFADTPAFKSFGNNILTTVALDIPGLAPVFAITSQGFTASPTDNGQILHTAFGAPRSITVVQLDGAEVDFATGVTTNFSMNGSTASLTKSFAGGTVLVTANHTLENNMIRTEYNVQNNDVVAHSIGIGIMTDTVLGANNNGQYTVNNQILQDETTFFGAGIPQSIELYDPVVNPSLKTEYVFDDGTTLPPDEVVLAQVANVDESAAGEVNGYQPPAGNNLYGSGNTAIVTRYAAQSYQSGERKEVANFKFGVVEPPSTIVTDKQDAQLQIGGNEGQTINLDLPDIRVESIFSNDLEDADNLKLFGIDVTKPPPAQVMSTDPIALTSVDIAGTPEDRIQINDIDIGVTFQAGDTTVESRARRVALAINAVSDQTGGVIAGTDGFGKIIIKSDTSFTINTRGTGDQINIEEKGAEPFDRFITALDDALEYIATHRARLGAAQNRLEFGIQTTQVTIENLSASRARIKDTDMAQETANLTKAQIITQAGQSVLAQANLMPNRVLDLLG